MKKILLALAAVLALGATPRAFASDHRHHHHDYDRSCDSYGYYEPSCRSYYAPSYYSRPYYDPYVYAPVHHYRYYERPRISFSFSF